MSKSSKPGSTRLASHKSSGLARHLLANAMEGEADKSKDKDLKKAAKRLRGLRR